MKKAFRIGLAGLWMLIATGFLIRFWLTQPDKFPRFPESLAISLVKLYGAQNADEIADLEILIGLGLSFIVISLLTLAGWFVWRRIKPR